MIVIVALVLIGIVLFTDDRGMRGDVLDVTRNVTTVGVVMSGPRDDDGWGTAHFRALEALKDDLNLRIIYRESVPTDERCIPVVEEVISEGATIVFATSFGFGAPIVSICDKFPKVAFFHCAGVETRPNLATYMGRMYQMRYLAGIAAGMQTDTGEIGYVAAMPIDEVVRHLNAFTLGVRSVNPDAKVFVAWTNTWIDYNKELATAEKLLDSHRIDVIAYHQDSDAVIRAAEMRGIPAIGYNVDKSARFPKTALTTPMWNWEPFYRRSILAVLEGDFVGRQYWLGVESEIVNLAPLADFAKPGIAEAVSKGESRLREGSWDVFYGPLRDNQGVLRIEAGTSMTDEQLLNNFDWYVDGVVIEPIDA